MYLRMKKLITKISQIVLPIFGVTDRGDLSLRGSGFIVHNSNDYYLVSAKHVLDQNRTAGGIHIFSTTVSRHAVTGSLRLTRNTYDNKDGEEADIGVIKLGPEIPKPPYLDVHGTTVKIDSRAVEMTDIEIGELPREKQLFNVAGYPQSKNKIKHVTRHFTNHCFLFSGTSPSPSIYEKLGLVEREHILFTHTKNYRKEETGEIIDTPDPAGISGSPIFCYRPAPHHPGYYEIKVVGVATRRQKIEKLLQGTDIRNVLRLITETRAADGRPPAV
jgi:hypothetical protein